MNSHHFLKYTLIWTLVYYLNTIKKIVLDRIEGRESINHEEYVENENYYNVYSDDYDDYDN